MPDTDRLLEQAHEVAQQRFRVMLEAKCYADPEDHRTQAYQAAERIVDAIVVTAQWEKSKEELDALITADRENDLAVGDHFAGMPR